MPRLFTNMEFKPVKSGNITEAAYDPASQSAHVRFKSGGHYEYGSVSPEEWASFEQTFQTDDSSGSHFHKYIKPKPFTRIK